MDIFNKIPAISEDTLVYNIYPAPNASDKSAVTALAASIGAFIETVLPNHIWHRDAFELNVTHDILSPASAGKSILKVGSKSNEGDNDHWMLEGYMRVGDSVDDEWLAVWLLKEISSRCDAAIS